MIRHWAFFKHGTASFGAFYPKNYIVAGFASMADAQAAERAFTESGVRADAVRAANGEFVATRLEAHHKANALDRGRTRNGGFPGIAATYLQQDADLAREGGAFLFLYAPDDRRLQHARMIFERHPPIQARRYLHRSIEPLIERPARPAA